jgi:hypothetical protein
MPNIYMFFDGSSLVTQIRQLQGKDARFKGHDRWISCPILTMR